MAPIIVVTGVTGKLGYRVVKASNSGIAQRASVSGSRENGDEHRDQNGDGPIETDATVFRDPRECALRNQRLVALGSRGIGRSSSRFHV